MATTLTIHRAAHEIGGNCIELERDGARLLLDAGAPLAGGPLVPPTLDLSRPATVVLSHPHQDHWGMLPALPPDWPVYAGGSAAELIRLTAAVAQMELPQPFAPYRSGEQLRIGPFSIQPMLTDHSAFDAHMLLVECAGKRVLYSGDFRRSGRKSTLVDRLLRDPPRDIDVLLLEGTTLGRFPSLWPQISSCRPTPPRPAA